MREAVDEAGVAIVTGDTKVVERDSADGLFVTTAGAGIVPAGRRHFGGECPQATPLSSRGNRHHGINATFLAASGAGDGVGRLGDAAPLNHLVAGNA